MEENQVKLIDVILNQEVVKLVNPTFFGNENEAPLMSIINGWLYHVLCIKQGLYGEEFSG